MRLSALSIGDPPERWEALGFKVVDGRLALGDVTLVLGRGGHGIAAWSLPAVDGLESFDASDSIHAASVHPNGATALDHVVVITPDFDRSARALEAHGLALKRIRDAGGFRQGFVRVGEPILELLEARGEDRAGPARFWGLVPIVSDLDALKERLGDLLSEPKPAVQPGRRIATLRREAGLSCAVAFMDAGETIHQA